MIYGDEKGRQMARSILPSQWRGAGRAKAHVRRAARRCARIEVAALVHDEDAWFDDRQWARETRSIVRERRNADKLNHFERWATAATKDLAQPDRVSHVKALMPKGLIGQHAVTHLVRWDAFEPLSEKERRAAWKSRPRAGWMDRGELAQLLRAIVVTPDAHAALNRALEVEHRKTQPERAPGATVRKLLGGFDVLPFLDALKDHRQLQAMRAFCATFKALRRR